MEVPLLSASLLVGYSSSLLTLNVLNKRFLNNSPDLVRIIATHNLLLKGKISNPPNAPPTSYLRTIIRPVIMTYFRSFVEQYKIILQHNFFKLQGHPGCIRISSWYCDHDTRFRYGLQVSFDDFCYHSRMPIVVDGVGNQYYLAKPLVMDPTIGSCVMVYLKLLFRKLGKRSNRIGPVQHIRDCR